MPTYSPQRLAMSRFFAVSLTFGGAVFISAAQAQTLYEAKMAGQVLNITKEGASVSCGYRFVVTSTNDSSKGRRLLDVALLVTPNGVVAKFDGRELPKGVNGLENLIPTKTYGGWLKSPGKKAATPLTDIPDGVTPPPPTMRLVDTAGAIEVFDAVYRGQPIQVAVNWTPDWESIYVGTVAIKQPMISQFYSCVGEVNELISKGLQQPKF